MMKLNLGLNLFDKNRMTSSIKFKFSYEKDTTKDSEARQLIKPDQPEPYRTIFR